MTQEDLGRAIGFRDGSYIQMFETGRRKLPLARLLALSRHTGIAVERLASARQRRLLSEASALMQPAEQGAA